MFDKRNGQRSQHNSTPKKRRIVSDEPMNMSSTAEMLNALKASGYTHITVEKTRRMTKLSFGKNEILVPRQEDMISTYSPEQFSKAVERVVGSPENQENISANTTYKSYDPHNITRAPKRRPTVSRRQQKNTNKVQPYLSYDSTDLSKAPRKMTRKQREIYEQRHERKVEAKTAVRGLQFR